jgi:hypothetical protein
VRAHPRRVSVQTYFVLTIFVWSSAALQAHELP